MGKRGFSATTLVLVAVLVGALFMVGKTVIPPPPGPPTPPPALTPAQQQQMVAKKDGGMTPAMKAEMMKRMQKMQKDKSKYMPPPKKFDPMQSDITARWDDSRAPGEEGNKQMADMVAKAKADQQKASALRAQTAAAAPNASK